MNHVIRGQQKEADTLLNEVLIAQPQLLREILSTKLTVTDYSNRTIHGTALQLALGAEDVKYHKNEVCMVEMLQKYLKEIPEVPEEKLLSGEEMFVAQYEEQFSAEAIQKDEERKKCDSSELKKILNTLAEAKEEDCEAVHDVDDTIQEILYKRVDSQYDAATLHELNHALLHAKKDQFDSAFAKLQLFLETKPDENKPDENKVAIVSNAAFQWDMLKALYQFRNYLESQTTEVIKNGKHFNAELLIEAFKFYGDNYAAFGDRGDSAKNRMSWRKIIGYIQRFLPVNLAQAFHQGIFYIVEDGQKLERLSEFKSDKPYKIVPFDSFSPHLLGYDFAGVAVSGRWAGRDVRWGRGSRILVTKLMSGKNINIAKLCNNSEVRNRPAR